LDAYYIRISHVSPSGGLTAVMTEKIPHLDLSLASQRYISVIIYSSHLSKTLFTGTEGAAEAGPIPSVENEANSALAVVISTRKRGRHTVPVDDDLVCNDPGCETLISDVDLLRCDSPGCYLVVSSV